MVSCYYNYHINSSQHQNQQQKQQQPLPSNPMSLKTSATTATFTTDNSKYHHKNRSAFKTVIKLKIPMSIQCIPKFGVPSKRTCLLEDRPVEKNVEDFMTLPKQKNFWETSCDLIIPLSSETQEQCNQHNNNHLTISLSTKTTTTSSSSSSLSKTSPSSMNFNSSSSSWPMIKSRTSSTIIDDDRDILLLRRSTTTTTTTKLYPVTTRLENSVF